MRTHMCAQDYIPNNWIEQMEIVMHHSLQKLIPRSVDKALYRTNTLWPQLTSAHFTALITINTNTACCLIHAYRLSVSELLTSCRFHWTWTQAAMCKPTCLTLRHILNALLLHRAGKTQDSTKVRVDRQRRLAVASCRYMITCPTDKTVYIYLWFWRFFSKLGW